jgi:hypothetical protein
MTVDALRAIARAHAILAWLATAAIVAALVIARRPARRAAVIAGAVASALVVSASALGIALHDPYRSRLRQRLFVASSALGWLFERKQHLAFGAVLLGLGALAALSASRRVDDAPNGAASRDLARAAWIAWLASALFALAASIASTIVARRAHF